MTDLAPAREGNPGLLALPLVIAGGFGLGFTNTGITAAGAGPTTALWLGSWLLTIGLLTVLVLRLPWTYPLLLGIVDVALVLLLIGNLTGSTAATHAGGWFVFAFVALVAYYFVAALWEETGGRTLPLSQLTSGRSRAGTPRCCRLPPRPELRAPRR
jgi:succinate-acetate transporter protein